MFGAELGAGYLFGWLVRKARRVGERADGQVDAALDATVDRLGQKLYDVVAGELPGDSSLERLAAEAQPGLEVPTERTAKRVALVLEDVAEEDPAFAGTVSALISELEAARQAGASVSVLDGGLAAGGNVNVQADRGPIAAGVVNGNVSLGNPQMPGTAQA